MLKHAAVGALALASNLERFTAREHIDYTMLHLSGIVANYNSGSFQYVYSIERQNGGLVSREYRTPIKKSDFFPESGQDVGQAAIALIFLPNIQTDYEMRCEGMDERDGQLDWVVHFQQRRDRPERTAKVWVNGVGYSGMFEGRAWISKENFQVIHLEASLMDGVPEIGLRELSLSVDYLLVQTPSGNLSLWLPNRIATYWDFSDSHTVLVHRLSDFELFAVDTQEKVQEPK